LSGENKHQFNAVSYLKKKKKSITIAFEKDWREEINRYTTEDCIVILIANKADLKDERKVKTEELMEFADMLGSILLVSIYKQRSQRDRS
jgi:GTPase SAR1 family protein